MLVLGRRLGESILIGDDVVITVVDVGAGIVRLGITAPRAMLVLREELVRDDDDDKNTRPEGADQ
jgi:carbon storage regulator